MISERQFKFKVTREPLLVPGDVISAVESLGLEIIRLDDDEATCRCPAHEARTGRPDRNPSFQINIESGLFICWSCKYSGNFTQLVADMRNLDFPSAQEWVRAQGTIGATIRHLNKAHEKGPEGPRPLSRAALALFSRPSDEMLASRDLRFEEASAYNILCDPRTGAWIAPMYDPETGALIGWQEKLGPRVRNFPKGNAKRNTTLFGIQLPPGETTVVVENPLKAAKVARVVPGAVATFGSKISNEQIDLIANRSDEVVIFMDNDAAGLEATGTLVAGLRGRGQMVRVVTYAGLPPGVDPGDLEFGEIQHQIINAMPSFWLRWAC